MGNYSQDRRLGKMTSALGKDALLLRRMSSVERLSEPFMIEIDAVSEQPLALHKILGGNVGIEYKAQAGVSGIDRSFNGQLWEYVELENDEDGYNYRLTLRPMHSFLTLNRRNRIFQSKSVKDIISSILIGDKEVKTTGSYPSVEYCVQYQESDFNFVSRLMEFEGMYYYFKHSADKHTLVLIDSRDSQTAMSPGEVELLPHDERIQPYLWSMTERRGVGPAKVTVDDYDFKAPTTSLRKSKPAGKIMGKASDRWKTSGDPAQPSWASAAEIYDFPSKFNSNSTSSGERYSAVWLDSSRNLMAQSFADGDFFAAAVGHTLKVKFANEKSASTYLIVGTRHNYTGPPYRTEGGEAEILSVQIELMPADAQFRPALVTPRPRVHGPQTAVVVGPAGEEIHTDEFGRIKVQFHWDREGKKDDKSSCFMRVAHAVAGKAWGNFSLPRIGQEVVVEFLDGDPDRPLVTGSVYNGENTVPAALPANKTQFGLKTRITIGGGGFNHWWIEDKKGAEVVWFRAERDYKANIVNADETRQYDKGNRTTTLMKGNDTLKLDEGDITTTVSKGKRTTTIQQDETLEVKMGNRSTTVSMGNDTLTVKTGNSVVKVNLGKQTTEAMQSIELKCGPSVIKLDPMQISLDAMTIKINGKLLVKVDGLMVQSTASALQTIKGAMVMIN